MPEQHIQFITDKMSEPVSFSAPQFDRSSDTQLGYIDDLFAAREDLEEIILNYSDGKFIKFSRKVDDVYPN